MKTLKYLTDSKRDKKEIDIIFSTMVYTLIGAFFLNTGVTLARRIKRKIENKNTENKCSVILLTNGKKKIIKDVPDETYQEEKYRVEVLDLKDYIIYVYGKDAYEYAYFMSSYIYFDENNKIILDIDNINKDNYQNFVNDDGKLDNVNVRNRKKTS